MRNGYLKAGAILTPASWRRKPQAGKSWVWVGFRKAYKDCCAHGCNERRRPSEEASQAGCRPCPYDRPLIRRPTLDNLLVIHGFGGDSIMSVLLVIIQAVFLLETVGVLFGVQMTYITVPFSVNLSGDSSWTNLDERKNRPR